MLNENNTPNFAAWQIDTLAQYASEAYHMLRLQQESIMQLQQDLKTAMAVNRALIVASEESKDDWK